MGAIRLIALAGLLAIAGVPAAADEAGNECRTAGGGPCDELQELCWSAGLQCQRLCPADERERMASKNPRGEFPCFQECQDEWLNCYGEANANRRLENGDPDSADSNGEELPTETLVQQCGDSDVEAFIRRRFAWTSAPWVDVLTAPQWQFGFTQDDLECRGRVELGQACEAVAFEMECRRH